MDDINFDELDKAVSSVLQQAPKKDVPETDVANDTAEDVGVESIPQTPSVTKPTDTAGVVHEANEVATAPTSASVVVPKRRGQFMDMIHPSSDMTTPGNDKPSIVKPSRQGGILQPLDPSIVEMGQSDDKSAAAISSDPVEKEIQTDVVEDSTEDSVRKSEWPDPLDIPDRADTVTATDLQASHVSGVAVSEAEGGFTDAEGGEETPEAQDSPFIKGTEVEKRPLGAFTESNEAETSDEPYVDSVAEPVSQALPEELAPEVVSVESDDPTRMTEELTDDGAPDGMSASIAQQYKPVSSVSEEDTHPVFDTKEYHQPLTPPAKKSHAGMVIGLLLLLVALGVGVWYAVFVLKLI